MNQRLKGKTAIVTGASRGIGFAIARAFAREGANVVVAARHHEGCTEAAASINREFPNTAFGKACHVGRSESVLELVAFTAREVGLPDVLVANAGTNPYQGPLIEAPEWAWEKTLAVNLMGCFWPAREVAKRLIEAGKPGSIMSVSSVAGIKATPHQGIYALAKAAVINMTKTLAFELGEHDIRVNTIAPGLVDTKLAASIIDDVEMTKGFTNRTALKRVAKPSDIAGMAVYLASDESSYTTGQTMVIDGGYVTG